MIDPALVAEINQCELCDCEVKHGDIICAECYEFEHAENDLKISIQIHEKKGLCCDGAYYDSDKDAIYLVIDGIPERTTEHY